MNAELYIIQNLKLLHCYNSFKFLPRRALCPFIILLINGERRRASTDATFEAFEVRDPHTGVLASTADLQRLRMITELPSRLPTENSPRGKRPHRTRVGRSQFVP